MGHPSKGSDQTEFRNLKVATWLGQGDSFTTKKTTEKKVINNSQHPWWKTIFFEFQFEGDGCHVPPGSLGAISKLASLDVLVVRIKKYQFNG